MTWKFSVEDVPPVSLSPPGLVTETATLPANATREAGTVAFRVFASTNCVVKAVVPKLIKALLWKLAPLTVKVKSDELALMLLGLSNVTVGIFLTMNSTLREVPPVSVEVPGLVTVTGTIPEEATREAGTVAVKVLLS